MVREHILYVQVRAEKPMAKLSEGVPLSLYNTKKKHKKKQVRAEKPMAKLSEGVPHRDAVLHMLLSLHMEVTSYIHVYYICIYI